MIVAKGLRKQFMVRGQTLVAVDRISFTVGNGEVYGLLGPNGAGKTTTLRMVMGLLEPDEGHVEIGGVRTDTDPMAIRSQLGLISTNDGVYPWLTVREMLMYFADLYAVEVPVAQIRLEELAELLNIKSFLDQRCSTLSTGQKQRVTLARGLMHDPPVMLLDEPTRGLDVVGSQTVFEFIELLKKRGKSVLLSTHRLDEAERVCDRFGLLHHGTVRYEGTLDDLRSLTGKYHLVDMFIDLIREDRQPASPSPAGA
ncbi:MAG: ATP-binding cassette domain-containing protein [Planctomycetes bacterium]|nr:ATP-binding cassette domain-containing protein [Planctomycetota bacterium]